MIKINQNIPNFNLDAFHNETIKKTKLEDYKGKWLVLLFYPADFTFVCPTELQEAANLHEKFKELGAEVLSVSTDTAYVHKAWHDTSPAIKQIQYPMLADPSGAFGKEFGIYIDEEGLFQRATVIVNPEGKLVFMEVHDNSIGRNMQENLRKLEAAIFVSKNQGQVCPASWKPGSNTLKPGVDLVGKI